MLALVAGALQFIAADSTDLVLTPWGGAGLYGSRYSTSKGETEFHDLVNSAPDDAVGINNLILGFHTESSGLYGAVALHYGDIARSGWDRELPWLYEAWIGYHVSGKFDITAGAFTSALGVETPISFENYSGIISVPGFINPSCYSGVLLDWKPSTELTFNGGVVSSFSSFSINADLPGILLGVTYEPGSGNTLSMQSMLTDEPLSADAYMQWYTNITATAKTDRFHVIAEAIICYEIPDDRFPSAFMVGGIVGAYYDIGTTGLQTGLRLEGVYDPDGSLADSRFNTQLPYKTLSMAGITTTISYRPTVWSLFRLDARYLGVLDMKSLIEINPDARERTEIVLSADIFFLPANTQE